MSLAAAYDRQIRSQGRLYVNESNQSDFFGYCSATDAPIICYPDAAVSPGDLLKDVVCNRNYIVTDIAHNDLDNIKTLSVQHYRLTATISRLANTTDNFGKSADLITVAQSVPTFRDNSFPVKKWFLPISTDCRQGDVITIDQSADTYEVLSIAPSSPGVQVAIVRQQRPLD